MNTRGMIAVLCVAAAIAFVGYALLGIRAELDDGSDIARDRASISDTRACIAQVRARADTDSFGVDAGDLLQC